ncbi:response regulator [Deinococcus malanensis]|uniref:response regulator n=1 Tax=Deinococcus malanensis TaxID=1706855 RepID=UPI00363C0C45
MNAALRILLLEPDPGDLLLMQEALARHPAVEVAPFHKAAGVLNALHDPGTALPHLIVMEPHLPQESGIDLIRTIKNDPRLKTIPVIAMSTVDDVEEVALSYSLGSVLMS